MKNYKKAKSYSWVLDHDYYIDRVHDAFIRHYNRTGENLFDKSEYYVFRAVKYAKQYERQQTKQFVEAQEGLDNRTPDRILEFKEEYQQLISAIQNQHQDGPSKPLIDELLQFIAYKVSGYDHHEIAYSMGISRQLVSYYYKRLKQIYEQL